MISFGTMWVKPPFSYRTSSQQLDGSERERERERERESISKHMKKKHKASKFTIFWTISKITLICTNKLCITSIATVTIQQSHSLLSVIIHTLKMLFLSAFISVFPSYCGPAADAPWLTCYVHTHVHIEVHSSAVNFTITAKDFLLLLLQTFNTANSTS